MPKQLLITGAQGQLGHTFQQVVADYPDFDFTFVGRSELDLSQPEQINAYFQDKDYDIIINCAAYTAVDKAETDIELSEQINSIAVKQLAQIAKEKNITLIHISTDYVFNGKNFKPYTEQEITHPINQYGQSKRNGELAMQAINPAGFIIRTSWVYADHGNNFLKTMLRLGNDRESLHIVADQIGSPTYTGDLASAILDILSQHSFSAQDPVEIYHYSNEGVCSWYDFATAIFEIHRIECAVLPISTEDYPTPAKRPYYSLMSKAKIKQTFGISIPHWRDSLNKLSSR